MEDIVIRVNHLTKSYRKGHDQLEVLKGIDLEINAGEVIGYLGSNGAGKSTTVKILCGILTDFGGEVNILGMDVRKDPLGIKRRIGYIPENALMYEHLTPREYLEFIGSMYNMTPADTQESIQNLLKRFGMLDHINERMTAFSKGMKQKIHIISGILHNPEILFMDEPLNGLDANAVIMIKEMIAQLAGEGKTIFYCSHLMDIVEKVASRIVLIDQGVVVANGSLTELKAAEGTSSLEALFAKLTNPHTPENQE